ncbi:MAG TPA: hypothetical protein VG276_12840 [Actinomycetes bacterium]|nr:hypothetical protein [Actinomycetes bacterium]
MSTWMVTKIGRAPSVVKELIDGSPGRTGRDYLQPYPGPGWGY